MENPSSKNFQVAEFILALKQIFEFVKKDFPGLYINTEDHSFELFDELNAKISLIGLRLKSQSEPYPHCSKKRRDDSCGTGRKPNE